MKNKNKHLLSVTLQRQINPLGVKPVNYCDTKQLVVQ